MATYVLVHGGQHGGWCWKRLARLLRDAGHTVYTPTMTGLGERSHLLGSDTGLDTHVHDIAAILEYEDLVDVILVGHSYGGMVITGVADRAMRRVGHLVYLDAAIPRNGESLVDLAAEPMAMAHDYVRVVGGVELVMFPTDMFLDMMGVRDEADRAWMAPRLTPQPWRSFAEPLPLPRGDRLGDISQSVIVTPTRIRGDEDRWEPARKAGRVWEIDAGHDLMVTEPQATAEMLLRIAQP